MDNLNSNKVWTPEMDAAIKKHAIDGMSGAQIADAINKDFKLKKPVTRNSVIGRSNRIGFSIIGMKKKPIKVEPKKKDRKITVRTEKSPENKTVPVVVTVERRPPAPIPENKVGKGYRLTDLGSCQCRWTESTGHPSQFLFCGATTKVGVSYCKEHLDRVYLKTPKKY